MASNANGSANGTVGKVKELDQTVSSYNANAAPAVKVRFLLKHSISFYNNNKNNNNNNNNNINARNMMEDI